MSKVINISNLKPGKTYKVSVRGNLSNGKKTTWSQNYTITTPSDTAPATPAVPTVSVLGPQKVLVTHDNKDSTGANLSDTNKLFEVYMSSTNSNSAGTLIGTIPAQKPSSGFNTVSTIAVNGPTTDATKYFYVKAVNFSGQRSASSATTSSVAITTFDSAYIGSLTADKIATGTLQANTSISVGSSTPIVLKANATTPYGQIYIGTGTYNNSNTAFYVDSNGKFSLKDKLTWDGTSLSITGAITATSGSFTGSITSTSGTIGGWTINTTSLKSSNNLTYLNNDGSITGATITGSSFKTATSGSYIYINQQIDSTYGTIGKINFVTGTGDYGTTFDGGIYATPGISLGTIYPSLLIVSPRTTDAIGGAEIKLVGGTSSMDGYIYITAGGTSINIDGTNGLMKLNQANDNLSTVLNTTGFRNVYVSSTAGNPNPSSPQNGDIKLEW